MQQVGINILSAGIVSNHLDKTAINMKTETHSINDTLIAEVISGETIINSTEDGLDLLGSLYFQGFDRIVMHEKHITPAFFDLKNGMAGEILQKFSNYRVRLAIVGDFSKYTRKSVQDFLYESNNGNQVNFVGSLEEGLKRLSR
ncbi:hypothetical protein GCM10011323_01110 [Pontibacter amylolyticus]|uniref:DUF4180 domain-containing protein n=2 Tax=Pontibacter amylolyticus TaxID=1424080 RepID=A0ABQ1VUJ4_9BACT|nr:hypothetical protein GCM10011323_01110 [Pontibacter amylolyticus]